MKFLFDSTREISPGVYIRGKCEICGKKKSVGNHKKCSKEKQKRFVKK